MRQTSLIAKFHAEHQLEFDVMSVLLRAVIASQLMSGFAPVSEVTCVRSG